MNSKFHSAACTPTRYGLLTDTRPRASIARWPGKIKEASVNNELIGLIDLPATAAAITGVKLPQDAAEDSYNLLPTFQQGQQKRPIREALVHHSNDGTFAIRQGDWKLVLGLGSHGFSEPREIKPRVGEAQGQLYNLRNDPAEQINLWLKQPDVVARLTALLEKYQREGRSAPQRR